ncbi:uncharacterized protein [Nothobranchius furzeri]|uniref:LOC107380526-like protein n=1 Tax=Nothobranchius furzeri TaxID=105023 RepID=A0A9D3BUL7_NOTFU|nr:putative LOC107380526-like protein [Nothobranchius furzeri]
MDDFKLIMEVEKHKELYDPQHPFYKDNSRKDNCWEAVATAVESTMEECKKRWKQLLDSFVKHKTAPSGSSGGSQKDWKYSSSMSFLLSHMQPSSKNTLPSVDDSEGPAAELSCDDTAPSSQISMPATPTGTPPQRSASPLTYQVETGPSTHAFPPSHPRVQALSKGTATEIQGRKHSKKKGTSPGLTEQQLLHYLTKDVTTVSPCVPEEKDEMYYYALSLVPRFNAMPRQFKTFARMQIEQCMQNLERQLQEINQPIPSPSTYGEPTQPPPTLAQQAQQYTPLQSPSQQRGVKRPTSMLEELEGRSSPTPSTTLE